MTDKLEKWKGYIPDDEIAAYAKGAFGRKIGWGERPALLNIDTTRMFAGSSFSTVAISAFWRTAPPLPA